MQTVEYTKMFALEDTHWWFRGKRRIVESMILRFAPGDPGIRILDVGCGTGAQLERLQRYGEVHGMDIHPLALELSRQRGLRNLLRASAMRIPFAAGRFGIIAALDVLYHRRISDVAESLGEIHRVCQPGGLVVITDSAFASLRGPHDAAVHGARRFRCRELAEQVERSGFTVLKRSYMNSLLFPVAVVLRLLSRARGIWIGEGIAVSDSDAIPESTLAPVAPTLNRLITMVYGLEASLLRYVDLPIGLSVLVVARKPAA